ncbi:protein kinase C-binding protein NELL1-like [Ostrea edulis]|uniref:protein kinase C-binding protein NELL1-like n=1 Tax=Ostrea edulis TaxID=37623 RepID=UPI0020965B51|nr:protein kinase C-binding protein NELL1-like [Ostrea edulis]XP_048769316.1 protein kinase C-binding protein NELL1-like [Ostrea edulis]XP_048769317.1 protein kinase C-binding protein NELL1-like [Ostrea edulis]
MGPFGYEYFIHRFITTLGFILVTCGCVYSTRDVLDLISNLKTRTGFTNITGQNNLTSAIYLQDSDRNLAVSDYMLREALRIFKDSSEITFLATMKQEVGNSGSILAFSSDIYRFFEIESSGVRDEIRIHYTHDQHNYVLTFRHKLADNEWHKLAVTVSGTHVTMFVDCLKLYEQNIQTIDHIPPSSNIQLYVGQLNRQHALFRGGLQDVQIVTQAHGYLLQCPDQDTSCPSCTQYQALEQKLQKAKERIKELEQCECHKNCRYNGTSRTEGEAWHPDQCTLCICKNGTVDCKKMDCPPAHCSHPVYRDGECCPICLTNCYFSGKYYSHGETVSPKVCVTCTCNDGRMEHCERMDPEVSCPNLDCPKEKRLHILGECCPVCEGTDFCGLGNNCHSNATCINLTTRFACQCLPGYRGDGVHCEDVDECLTKGGKYGHHCNGQTICENTIGSYLCKCPAGHIPEDPYNCTGTGYDLSNSAPVRSSDETFLWTFYPLILVILWVSGIR